MRTMHWNRNWGLTVCPKTITELICFQILRCKITLRYQKLILTEAELARNDGSETTQIPCKNYGAQKEFQDYFWDVVIALWNPKRIVQK